MTHTTKRGSYDNVITYEHMCDTTEDLQKIKPEYINLGSVAIVLQGDNGLEVYMANSQKEWIPLIGTSGGDSDTEPEKIEDFTINLVSFDRTLNWNYDDYDEDYSIALNDIDLSELFNKNLTDAQLKYSTYHLKVTNNNQETKSYDMTMNNFDKDNLSNAYLRGSQMEVVRFNNSLYYGTYDGSFVQAGNNLQINLEVKVFYPNNAEKVINVIKQGDSITWTDSSGTSSVDINISNILTSLGDDFSKLSIEILNEDDFYALSYKRSDANPNNPEEITYIFEDSTLNNLISAYLVPSYNVLQIVLPTSLIPQMTSTNTNINILKHTDAS